MPWRLRTRATSPEQSMPRVVMPPQRWHKILESDTIKVRFKMSNRPEPREIEVAVVTLLP